MAITNKDELDKKLVEQDGEIAALKAKADEVEKLKAEQAESKKSVEEMRAKLAEVTSKNWVEKYSTKDTKEEKLYRFGKYLQAMIKHDKDGLEKYGQGGRALSPDQSKAWGQGDNIVQKDDLGTPLYSDAITGSYLIPVEYAAEILRVAKQASQLMGQVREVPMNSHTKIYPAEDAAASVTWKTLQSTANTETTPTFTYKTLTEYPGVMWSGVTEELVEDSMVPVAAHYRDLFGEAFGYEFDYQVCQGSGSPHTGILSGASNALVMGAGEKTFSDLKVDDLYDAIAKLTTVNKRVGGVWCFHCTVFDILRKLKDANGNYIVQQPTGTQPGSLCGYPYIISDGMVPASSSDVSTKFVWFGNPKHMLWGNRLGVEFKVFDQTAYAVQYDEVLFRGRVRWAFTVGIPAAFVTIATAAS